MAEASKPRTPRAKRTVQTPGDVIKPTPTKTVEQLADESIAGKTPFAGVRDIAAEEPAVHIVHSGTATMKTGHSMGRMVLTENGWELN